MKGGGYSGKSKIKHNLDWGTGDRDRVLQIVRKLPQTYKQFLPKRR
jgi:hypothetical protein